MTHADFLALATGNAFKGLQGGDVVRFTYRGATRTAAVIPMLRFADHVVVRFTSCGHVVDADNFLAIVRRAKRN